MTLTVALRLTGDATQARNAVRQTAAELKGLGTTSRDTATASRAAAQAQDTLAADLREAEAAARAAAAAQAAHVQTMRDTAQTHTLAAGSVGNLTAQFNDIGMMLAAGQNPLMLALQQGSQITQVFGNAGAASAVSMLKSAFLNLLSPVNLITLGVIGFGAAAIQWLTAAGEEALSLEDAVGALSDRVDAYKEAAERANASTADLRREFGDGAEAARAYARELAELERREAERAVREANAALRETLAPIGLRDGAQKNAADFFDLSLFGRGREEVQAGVNELLNALNAIDRAKGFESQEAAVLRLRSAVEALALMDGQYTAAEDAALRQINALLEEQRRLLGAIAQDQAAATANNGRFATADQIIAYQAAQAAARAEDQAWAAETLASLQAEAQLNQLIAQYGNDSAVVAAARANAERAVFAAMVDSMNVAQAMKDELIRAYDAANAIARANIAAMLSAAVGQASRLAAQLWDAARASSSIGSVAGMAERAAGAAGGWLKKTWSNMVTMATKGGDGGGVRGGAVGGGGGGGGAKAEADAVAELIERMEREIELLRETDPIKKEMLRYREQLATATEAERAKVEELIATRIREDQQIKARADLLNYANDMTLQFLNTVIVQGKSAKSILSSLVNELLRAFVTGKGVFAEVFGLKGGIWDAIFPRRQDGGIVTRAEGGIVGAELPPGLIQGPGTGRADRILARVSNGEFIVNAKATARHRALLETLNAGAAPAYAEGGMVGRAARYSPAPRRGAEAARPVFNLHFHSATGNAEVRRMVSEGVAAGLRIYDADALPRSVLGVVDDPKVTRR